jgi:AcrR family transcriptional regulator
MPGDVKPKRRYESPRRQEQAAATRAAILDAAQQLFERQGYIATSVGEIAADAGVALKTVYAVFGTKRGVLMALRSRLVRGDDEPVPVHEREWFRAVLAEPDPRKLIAGLAHQAAAMKERAGTVFEIIRNAAPADPQIAALWDQFMADFYETQRVVIEELDKRRVLKLDPERATDVLWTVNHPAVYHLLAGERGWTTTQYEQWLDDTLAAQLLSSPSKG